MFSVIYRRCFHLTSPRILARPCTSSTSGSGGSNNRKSSPPKPPDNCCQQGCANCVWIRYAEELIQYYEDGGDRARAEIERLVTDPTLKIFLRMEMANK